MRAPKFIKSKINPARGSYQAVFKRHYLCIRKGPPKRPYKYRIFFNGNVVVKKDENGKYFNQFHNNLKSAKNELLRIALLVPSGSFRRNLKLAQSIYRKEKK